MGRNIVCLVVFFSGMITTSRTYENAAAGKSSSASQSSTDGSHSAAFALNGKTDHDFSSCSHTQEENQPWWQVDLGKDYIVFAVRIWNVNHVLGDGVTTCRKTENGEEYRGTINRTENGYTCEDWSDHPKKTNMPSGSVNYCRSPDTGYKPWCYCNSSHCPKKEGAYFDWCDIPMCGDRLSDFTISLDDQSCRRYTRTVANGASPEITCDTPVIGRILKIQLLGYTFLTLCEVSVRGIQYQETPTVSEYGSSTPTSISVQWPNIVPIDSTSGIVIKYYVVYKQLPMASETQQSPAIGKGMMNATISGLKRSTEYSVGLKIEHSYNGRVFNRSQGPMTTLQTHSCENYMITPVLIVEGKAIDTSLKKPNRAFLTTNTQVTGMLPACIRDFDIYYKATRDTSFKRIRNTAPINNKIQNLIPFTAYDVIPSVVSPDGKVRNGTSIKIRTAEDIPPAPSIIKTGVGPTSISVRVIPPNPSYGVITNYSLEMCEYNDDSRMVYLGPTDTSFTFDKLKFETRYTFRAKAFTSKGAGDWSEAVTIVTVESIPGPPNTLEVTEQTTSSLVLIWTQPKFQSGTLLDYKVICSLLFSYDENINKANNAKAFNPAPDLNKLKVSGLTPATEYNCSVAAQTSKGYGPSVWMRNWTKPDDATVPENLFLSIFPDHVSDTTITVQVNKMPKMLKTGSVSKLQIAVEKFGQGRRKRSIPLLSDEHSKYTDHATATEKSYPGYIAAELAANFSGPFIIGDGNGYGGYYNAPLESGQSYDVIFGMVFEVGELSTVAYRRYGEPIAVKSIDNIESVVWIVVGVVIGFLVIQAVIISVVVSVKRRRRNEETRIYEQPIPMNATSQNEDIYDELTTTNDQAIYYNVPPANEPDLYENIVDGAKKGPGGNVAVVYQEEYDNPNIDNEDVYENPDL